MKILKGNSGNSVLLAVVKAFTTVSGILSTMIMSHALSLELYGTFSQTNLIVTTATNLTALGLVDAVNYFYNRSNDETIQKAYINTIMGFQTITGVIAGLLIIHLSNNLVEYFNNPMLSSFFWLIAFRPLFANLNVSLQYLQVSIGKAKSVAVRNAGFATLRLVVYAIAARILHDITIVLIAFLAFEVVITIFFGWTFVKEKFMIKFYAIDWGKAKEILGYSIPMGIYVLTNSLCRDIDKMLIGGWYSTDQYAIYANCATLLPFDIISASFLTILIPILTRYFGEKDYVHGRILFKNYLKIGYYTSFTFTIVCMILSKEMVLFLYGEKYLAGQSIFILYTVVDMIKFANMSIVLSASGKTKTLMVCSLASLLANTGCNIVFYHIFGFVGPAIATVFVTVILTVVLAEMSAKSLNTSIWKLVDWKEFFLFAGELFGIGIICFVLKRMMEAAGVKPLIILCLLGAAYVFGILVLNKKKIFVAMKEINSLH